MTNFNSILKRLKLTAFQFLFYLIVFVAAIIFIVMHIVNDLSVKNNFELTVGIFVEYSEFGVGPNRYLTYKYFVDGVWHRRKFDGPKRTFPECIDNPSNCSEKKFVVIYNPKNPKRSLIDLTNELENGFQLSQPESLSNFQ